MALTISAVRTGEVDESVVDDKVLRSLRLAARIGALDGVTGGADARPWTPREVAAELRATAAAGLVLGGDAAPPATASPTLSLDVPGLRRSR